MPGSVIYDGPSLFDGSPIVVVAIWSSRNRKTGDMLQTYIIRSDMDPLVASKYGYDESICGTCKHRGTPTRSRKRKQAEKRTCYVTLGQGPLIVYRGLKAGKYPKQATPHGRINVGRGRMVRIGTYGDGAAVPAYVWDELLKEATGHTAYTHGEADPGRFMISADSLDEAQVAWSAGRRTFRVVRDVGEIVSGKEIECPSERGVQCVQCRLCGGSDVQAKSIAIVAHGNGAKYF